MLPSTYKFDTSHRDSGARLGKSIDENMAPDVIVPKIEDVEASTWLRDELAAPNIDQTNLLDSGGLKNAAHDKTVELRTWSEAICK